LLWRLRESRRGAHLGSGSFFLGHCSCSHVFSAPPRFFVDPSFSAKPSVALLSATSVVVVFFFDSFYRLNCIARPLHPPTAVPSASSKRSSQSCSFEFLSVSHWHSLALVASLCPRIKLFFDGPVLCSLALVADLGSSSYFIIIIVAVLDS